MFNAKHRTTFTEKALSGAKLGAKVKKFIWTEVTIVFLGLAFWGLAGRIFDVRQGKRLFGLIGTGEMLAGVAGGLAVSAFVGLTGTSNLLIISLLGLSLCILTFFHITRRYSSEIGGTEEEEEPVEKMSLKQMFAHRYLSLIFVICVLSVSTYYFIDYAFYDKRARAHRGVAFRGATRTVAGFVRRILKSIAPTQPGPQVVGQPEIELVPTRPFGRRENQRNELSKNSSKRIQKLPERKSYLPQISGNSAVARRL